MSSASKAYLLNWHKANRALNTPLPAQTMRHSADFSADEAISPLDERIIASASEAMEAGQTHYVDVPGIAPLRAALADFLNSACGSAFGASNIIVTAGVQEARFLTIQKIGEMFDSIGVPAVAHPGVQKALGVRKRHVVSLPVDDARGYLPTIDGIAAAVADGCRLLYLESPSRLSGAAYAADEVAAICQIVSEHDAAVIWDQGLSPWVAGNYSSLTALESTPTRIAVLSDGWPGMGLSSWFLGAIAAPENWVASMQSQKQIMAICTATATQYAALEASQLYSESQAERLAQLGQQREALLQAAAAADLEALAGGALNIVALRAGAGGEAALEKLRGVGADGADFGAPDTIRLTISAATASALA